MTTVLILGSGPNVLTCRDWDRAPFDAIIAINNAWAVRPDWDYLIHPEDFPPERRPTDVTDQQTVVTAADYVPLQNRYGGFVYAGGTMAFTAGYWALGALKPKVMAFLGCDMVYDDSAKTHFYGKGTADPLRRDVTLRSLEGKAARLMALAAKDGCATVNLSTDPSRLVFPRETVQSVRAASPHTPDEAALKTAEAKEAALGYMIPSGRYWEVQDQFDPSEIDDLDAKWRAVWPAMRP